MVKTIKGREVIWEGLKESCQIEDDSFKSLTFELNKMFRKYNINKCIQKITFLAQVNAETGFFSISHEELSKYLSSRSKYKGRGLIQLTGNLNKAKTSYDVPGPYEKYGKYIGDENKFINNPNLIATDLHYTVDSSGWEWEIEKKVPVWNPNIYNQQKTKDAVKWKVEKFAKGLGKSLNQLALVLEETGEEKYFWLQSKMLNGYLLKDTDSPDPHGWSKRKEGLRKLKQWFKYDKNICNGEKELEYEEEEDDGVLEKMKKIVDKHYEYKQETNKYRTEVSDKGLEFMDCSELVSRYLYELGIGINKTKNEPIYMTTADMTTEKAFRNKLGNENIDLVGKEESFKPQRGDIFAWGYSTGSGWNGHTGIVYKYDEKKDLVTILEAIGKYGSADESQNTVSNGGFPGKEQTRTAVFKRTSKALVNHKGWFGYYRPKNLSLIHI